MADFSNTEKIDILIKESFNVASTNETQPWYLETTVDYTTWTNGSDILLDVVPNTVDWNSATSLSDDEMSKKYGLSLSDFYSGGGIKEDPSGVLHKFEKLKLEGISKTETGTNTFYSYYKKNTNNNTNILENSFQKNFGDGSTYEYQLYKNDTNGGIQDAQPTGGNGNWFFNFKNGILFSRPRCTRCSE